MPSHTMTTHNMMALLSNGVPYHPVPLPRSSSCQCLHSAVTAITPCAAVPIWAHIANTHRYMGLYTTALLTSPSHRSLSHTFSTASVYVTGVKLRLAQGCLLCLSMYVNTCQRISINVCQPVHRSMLSKWYGMVCQAIVSTTFSRSE